MRTTYITAAIIAVLLVAWLYSGNLSDDAAAAHPTLAEMNVQADARHEDKPPTRVRATVIRASSRQELVRIRGKTENKRTVEVKSEISGRIVSRPVERGSKVVRGDLLCEVSVDDRHAGLIQSTEAVNQAQIEYSGRLKLKDRGLQSDTAIAEAKARLAAARADLTRSRLALERTRINAPFAGTVEQIDQEIGDFVTAGSICATIVDLDPMLLTGRVSERDVARIHTGQQANARLADGRQLEGPISFVGQQSDRATRTYAIEIELPNADYALRSGITADIWVPVADVMAQRISPALFGLDDQGRLGIRILDANAIVRFVEVKIVDEDVDGVWITGLPEIATLITVGQELVVDGERVEIVYEGSDMPVATPSPEPSNSVTTEGAGVHAAQYTPITPA